MALNIGESNKKKFYIYLNDSNDLLTLSLGGYFMYVSWGWYKIILNRKIKGKK